MQFASRFEELAPVSLPEYKGTRVMMMPLILGELCSVPSFLSHYKDALSQLFSFRPEHSGHVGYITIDEKRVRMNNTHRRAGLHVDGVFRGIAGPWGGGGGWGSVGNGMITVASHVGCRAFNQTFDGLTDDEGGCEHMRDQLHNGTVFEAGVAYWLDGLCVHESLPQHDQVDRQFVRLSMPSEAAWFEGYTKNPLGISPTGPILPRREFMDS